MTKSIELSYYEHKINTTPRRQLLDELADAPLKDKEREFIVDVVKGYSLKELSAKYNICISRVTQRKREIFLKLQRYDSLRA